MALCALSIWAFTPVSELDKYIPVSDATSILSAHQQPISTERSSIAPFVLPEIISNESPLVLQDVEPLVKLDDMLSNNKQTVINPFFLRKTLGITEPARDKAADIKSLRFTIKPGDTLTKIFSDIDLPISLAIKLARLPSAKRLNQLSVGKTLDIYYDYNHQLTSLEYSLSNLDSLVVTHDKGNLSATTNKKEVQYREFTAQGVISSSMSMAADKAGLSMTVANKIIEIYQWEIDFARDLQKGDTFSVVYQKAYVDGKYIEDGEILATSFNNNGRKIDAIRYTDKDGVTAYFQPNGESLKRGFLRSPIKVARVTSKFGRRMHPIKKRWKAHKGVDYGAKRGTAIVSTADGVIQYAGNKSGYGKTVILRHGGMYTTLYAHMSRFEKGIRTGKSVKQGQIIGRVGHTGWATGDHLHYEFRVNGAHKNPLKVKLPKTLPLAKKEIIHFNVKTQPLLAQLGALQDIRVASSN